MKIVSTLSSILSQDKVQRLCYALLLLLWITIWIDLEDWQQYADWSKISADYFFFFMVMIFIPTGLLVLQIVFNNQWGWVILFSLLFAYSIWLMYISLMPFSTFTSNPFHYILFFMVLFCTNWILYKMRPAKRIKTK